tara:strand:- start:10781 stop:11617 length:837 start_codon:yes stop_codon:yes gene_type:complete
MIKKVKLPNYLKPYENKNIIRLGNDYDGGYLVDKESVLSTDVLISIGISYDWSFERDFFKLNKCETYAYDGSVGKSFFYAKIKTRIKNIFKIRSLNYFTKTIWWILLPIRFYLFFNNYKFSKKKKHYEMFVYENEPSLDIKYFIKKNGYNPKFLRFNKIFKKISEEKNIFLKIDIEGEEYQLLDSIMQLENRLTSLVIEFHNLNEVNYQILQDFINKFKLTLSHTHINISGSFNEDQTPKVIELTFIKNLKKDNKVNSLPHPLDMDTFPTDIKYEITF